MTDRETFLQIRALCDAQLGAAPPVAETPEQIVTRLYWDILHRAPDEGGLAWWAAQLRTGGITEAILRQKLGESPEARPPRPASSGYPFAGEVYAFTWGQVGHTQPHDFQPGVCYAFRTDVPAGYAGTLAFYLVELNNGMAPLGVDCWIAASPNGAEIASTRYQGNWDETAIGPEFGCKPAAGAYWFHVVTNRAERFGVRQDHQ